MSVSPSFRLAIHGIVERQHQGKREVLLGQRINTSYGDGLYSFPAGHVEMFETIEQALCRETKEELGVVPVFNSMADRKPVLVTQHLKDYGQMYEPEDTRFRHYIEHFFRMPQWQGQLHNAEPDKCADLRFFAVDDLPPNMLPLARHALQHIDSNRGPFSSFGWDNPDYPRWKSKFVPGG